MNSRTYLSFEPDAVPLAHLPYDIIPVSDKLALILLVVSLGLIPSPLMSMLTDMANVSAIGQINKHSNFAIRGAGSALSKHKRHRDECLFIRHGYVGQFASVPPYVHHGGGRLKRAQPAYSQHSFRLWKSVSCAPPWRRRRSHTQWTYDGTLASDRMLKLRGSSRAQAGWRAWRRRCSRTYWDGRRNVR